jgi:glycerophosphoryl diester phosphodiesterase
MSAPFVCAHRGGRRWPGIPENSVAAFERAIECGADMVEFDVRRLRDGELIVHHDPDLNGRPLAAMSHPEMLDAGGRELQVARLDEVLDACAGRIRVDVELKEAGYEREVLDRVLDRFSTDQAVFTSFLDGVVGAIKRERPDVRAGLLLGASTPPSPLGAARVRFAELTAWRRVEACGADFVAPYHGYAAAVAAWAARRGWPVAVWTVNGPRPLRRWLRDTRIEAVITDTPVEALRIRSEVWGSREPGSDP